MRLTAEMGGYQAKRASSYLDTNLYVHLRICTCVRCWCRRDELVPEDIISVGS